MTTIQLIRQELNLFPKANLQDIYKLFYQDFFGPSHFIPEKESAKIMIEREIKKSSTRTIHYDILPVFSVNKFLRVDLSILKSDLDVHQFSEIFFLSTKIKIHQPFQWKKQWDNIMKTVEKNYPDLLKNISSVNEMKKCSIQNLTVHHSRIYNLEYQPHYRLIAECIWKKSRFAKLF